MTKKLVFDLDGTLTQPDDRLPYTELLPDRDLVDKLRAYKECGYEIIIQTARNMRTHANNVGKINALTLPLVIDWLYRHQIPFDEIHVGKPWCGTEGFYVDDRAIRPSEFKSLSVDEIDALLQREKRA